MQLRLILISVLIFGTGLSANAEPDEALRNKIIISLVETHVRPGYQTFAKATKNLSLQTTQLCKSANEGQLANTRKAFSIALKSWMTIQHLKFGPVMKNDRIYRIQYWPDKHGQGAKHLRKILNDETRYAPAPAQFQKTSVALQGFGAIERYLFSSATKVLLANNQQAKRLCGFAQATADNLSTMAGEIDLAWSMKPDQSSKELVQIFFQMFNDQLLVVEKLKILRPLGKSLEKARGKQSESWRSKLSFENIADNLEGLSHLFDGENGGIGLKAGMVSEGETADFDKAISDQLKYVIRFARSIDVPLKEAVSDKNLRNKIIFLKGQIAEIRSISGEYLATDLGVKVGFNALDGD